MFDFRITLLFCDTASQITNGYVLKIWGTWTLDPLATHMPAGKAACMNELQVQHCMTPER